MTTISFIDAFLLFLTILAFFTIIPDIFTDEEL